MGGVRPAGSWLEALNDVWYMPLDGGEGEGEGEGEPGCEGEPVVPNPDGPHSADVDGDWWIDLVELLRVIQFYNVGGLHCPDAGVATEDGYLPGAGDHTCAPHSCDYRCSPDWQVELSELLRVVQFFRGGGYHLCSGTEDGYCPGSP